MGDIIFTAKNKITENSKAATWVADGDNLLLRALQGFVKQKGDNGEELLIGTPPEKSIDDNSFSVKIFENSTEVKEGNFVFITEEPKMPKLKVEINMGKNCDYQKVYFRLKIQFKFKASEALFDRNDIDYFPNHTESGKVLFMVAEAGKKTNWDVDFRGLFRGGTGVLEVYDSNKSVIKTITFYIRGKNPTKKTIKAYLEQKGFLKRYWFLYKLILSESGSEPFSVIRQFWDPEYYGKGKNRKEAKYGPSGRNAESKGMPSWGVPDGWGMCQIDYAAEKRSGLKSFDSIKKYSSYIWNWEENISIKMEYKIPEKIKYAKAHIKKLLNKSSFVVTTFEQQEGNMIYKACPSTIPELSEFNKYMPQVIDGPNTKSVLDAELIKLYNGGHYITDIDKKGNLSVKRFAEWNNTKIFYVERISNIKE